MNKLKEFFFNSFIYSIWENYNYIFKKNCNSINNFPSVSTEELNIDSSLIYGFFKKIDNYLIIIEKKIANKTKKSQIYNFFFINRKKLHKISTIFEKSYFFQKFKKISSKFKINNPILYFPLGYVIIDFVVRTIFTTKILAKIWDELLFLLVISIYFAKRIKNNGKIKYKFTFMDLPLLIFIMIGIVHVMIISPDKKIAIDGFRVVFQYVLWYYLFVQLINDTKDSKKIINILILLGLFLGLHSLFQYFSGVQMPSTWVDITESIKFRAFSIVKSPNILGALFVIFIPLSISFIIVEKEFKNKLKYIIVTFIMIVGILMTFSRGAWLALAASIVIFILLLNANYIYIIVIGTILFLLFGGKFSKRLLFLFSPAYIQSSAKGGRLFRWLDALKIWQKNKFFGLGLGRFGGAVASQNNLTPYYLDNYYLKILLEMGIFGMLGFLLVILCVVIFYAKFLKKYNGNDKVIVVGLFSSLLGVLIHNIFENIFEVPMMIIYFWLLVALINTFFVKLNANDTV